MRGPLTIGVLVGSLAMVGCSIFTTELKSEKLTSNTTPGLIYRLPAKQFSLSAIYQVTGCQVDAGNTVKLDADVKATLSERLVGDEAYTISYKDLDSWTKITNTTFHLSEAGLLTGVNANITDQTGAVIQNTVATAASIARAVALPPVLPTQAALQSHNKRVMKNTQESGGVKQDKANPSLCDEVNELLNKHENAKAALKAERTKDKQRDLAKRKKGEAEAEIARLSALKDIYEALGKDAAKDGLMTRLQEQEKRQADATKELDGLGESGTDKSAEALVNAATSLTITATNDWVPKTSNASLEVKVTDKDIPQALRDSFDILPKLPKVTLQVHELTVANTQVPHNKSTGIAYRIPAVAMARVSCECPPETRMLIEQPTQVPQFGPVGLLDLKNGVFANNTLDVAFNEATGAPNKLVFRSNSRAEAASASARDAASSYLQLQKDKRDDIRAANKAAIDQQTALLALEKTRNDVALAGTQAAAAATLLPVTTEKSLVAAQIELLRDQQRLDAVRTGTASTAEVQLEALVNHQKLLEQQLKILQIEQQIAEQKLKAQTNIGP